MSFGFTLTDDATPMLERVSLALNGERINPVIGAAVRRLLIDHFTRLEQERPNKLGGPRTHFYAQAARGTQFKSDGSGATISVNQVGIRQRLQGGTILPKNGKYLTIPAIPEAHGRRAREFPDLKPFYGAKGPAGLKNPAGEVVYWLATKVEQKADRTVVPSDEEIVETARQAAGKYFARLTERGGGHGGGGHH